MAASVGYPEEIARAYEEVPVDAALPLCEALRSRRPIFLGSVEELRALYSHLTTYDPASRAWAAMPLDGRERTLGAIALNFHEAPRDQQARDRIDRLIHQCGLALDRAALFDSARAARDSARAANRAKDDFLAMLGHELRNPLAPITMPSS